MQIQNEVDSAKQKARERLIRMKRAVRKARELIEQIERQVADPNVEHITLPHPKQLLSILSLVTFIAEAGIYPLAALYYANLHPNSKGMPWVAYWSTTGRGFRLCTDPHASHASARKLPGEACQAFLADDGVVVLADPEALLGTKDE